MIFSRISDQTVRIPSARVSKRSAALGIIPIMSSAPRQLKRPAAVLPRSGAAAVKGGLEDVTCRHTEMGQIAICGGEGGAAPPWAAAPAAPAPPQDSHTRSVAPKK